MSGRGGRDRFRRDYHALRIEDKSSSRTSNKINPPSRHLWVGNLSHGILEDDLTHHFLQFGELESVAFQPGRSYAFLNFRREDDAIAAMSALQGVPVAGNPLRIEFTKADKSSSRDEDYSQRRDELRSAPKESSFSEREFRARNASPDPFYADKSNVSDKNVEPTSVLWIGFPALLKVDELILRKAFEPFGEIEKITAFPGRSYAFVQFSSIMSACKAKETLQGKLFGNPRVHICFAKSQSGLSNSGRSLMNASPSPHSNSNVHPGSTGNFSQYRSFGSLPADLTIRSPQSFPDLDAGDSDAYSFNRKRTSWTDGSRTFQNRRFGEVGADLGVLQDTYEDSSSPTREGHTQLDDYSKRFVELSPSYEDAWDLPEDVHFYPGAKKLKSDSFTRNQDLLEHSFSDFEQQKYIPKAYSDFLQPEAFDKNFEAAPFGYKQTPDHRPNVALPHADRSDHWGESYDIFKVGSDPLPSNPTEKNRFTPESDQSSLNEWKWEGTIAKGGNPVCRARCFPVGRVLDIMLPEFLDCTARTGLDMLSKHYFQAANAWVVFFVPESDAHIGFYNEFMHYLQEKQRAAVSKLDEKTTLFLVPPSEFSEKVLKVPGNLSISGVVLRLDHSGSNFGSLHYQNEKKNSNLLSINGDTSYTKPSTSLLPIRTLTAFPDLGKSGVLSGSFAGNAVTSGPSGSSSGSAYIASGVSHSYIENKHDYRLGRGSPILGQNFSSPHHQNSDAGGTNGASQPPNSADILEHRSVLPNSQQETNSGNYRGIIAGISLSGNRKPSLQGTQTAASVPLPMAAAPPTDQISQLASSLLGQQRLSGSTPDISMGDEFRQINTMNESQTSTSSGLSASLSSQDHQLQQLQQQTGPQQSELLQNNSAQGEAETDPQKRLQATLQLAAALLQQIQQGK